MSKVAFHMGQALVGGDHPGGIECVRADTGADDVDPVQCRLGVDVGLVTLVGEACVSDVDGEVFGHLCSGR